MYFLYMTVYLRSLILNYNYQLHIYGLNFVVEIFVIYSMHIHFVHIYNNYDGHYFCFCAVDLFYQIHLLLFYKEIDTLRSGFSREMETSA